MNVELKKVKVHPDMSDETNCFSAEVWVDGRKLADVQNDGHGGSNMYYPVDGRNSAEWDKFQEWCKAQPHEFEFEYEDQVVDKLLQEWDEKDCQRKEAATLKRACKTQTVFLLKGDKVEDGWRTVKALFSPAVKDFMLKKYGDNIARIANEEVTA